MRLLRDMTVEELEKRLREMRAELMRVHVREYKGSRFTMHRRSLKRDVARILTVLKERGLSA